jgi:hypothetical protein
MSMSGSTVATKSVESGCQSSDFDLSDSGCFDLSTGPRTALADQLAAYRGDELVYVGGVGIVLIWIA